MKNTKQESDIIALLDGNATFRLSWSQPPQVAHIPFMGSREKCFLLVNVHLRSEANGREKLVVGCFEVVQSIIGSGLLTDEKAVEISAFVDVLGRESLRRIFRLTVFDIAFVPAMQIAAADLLTKQHSGITCQWPLQAEL